MKHIIAYIKPHKLDAVTQALHQIDGLTGLTVLDVKGFGRGRKKKPLTEEQLSDFVRHLKIEIFCTNELTEEIIGAIERAAHTGLRGDGKIYVCEAMNAVRISSGERGLAAV
ncbi:MAG: P-II family nitrogen regulator [Calditrichaeota bacterium]|nr:P-II family nitrogen regulator [Calditrichota bacterium]